MEIKVFSRSGREIVKGGLSLPDEATVDDLKRALLKINKKWSLPRQRITLKVEKSDPPAKPTVLENGKRLSDFVSSGGSKELEVVFKDLGPQIGYSTVFFWEYFGPLVIFPLFYFFPQWFYGPTASQHKHHAAQTFAVAYWSLHYAKRIFETYFVHHFSHGTMPIANLFRNCAYYWLFAAFVSFFVNHPLYTPVSTTQMAVGFSLALVCQLANLYCHVILRGLRPAGAGSKGGYQIPRGFLFNFITCANYTAEIYGWLGFNVATQTVAGYLFMLAGAYQMVIWAIAKHKRLRKLFDGQEGRQKYPRRWIILPPFL